MKYHFILIFPGIFIFLIGCSSVSNSPASVKGFSDDNSVQVADTIRAASPDILGIYDLIIDTETGIAQLAGKRSSSIGQSYSISGTSFFSTYPCNDCFTVHGMGLDDEGNIKLEFKIRHPMKPGNPLEEPSGKNRLDLDIFDLAMVVVPLEKTPSEYPLSNRSIYPDVLSEPDGYTTELANCISDDSAMPYVLVVDDNQSEPPVSTFNRSSMGVSGIFGAFFKPGPAETIHFELYLTFSYGISATWENRLDPVYYNPEFNRKSAWKVGVRPPTPWVSSDNSTPVFVKVSVYDWQIGANVNPNMENPDDIYAASDVESVSIEIPGMNNNLTTIAGNKCTGKGTPDDPLVYFIPVVNENQLPAGNYTGLVKIKDERVPGNLTDGRDFLIHSPDGSNLIQLQLTEFATYQTFPAVINDDIVLNPVDRTPEYLCLKPEDIAIYENYAVVAGGNRGVHFFDISDPENIRWLTMIDTPGYANGIDIKDGYTYIADHYNGLVIIDTRPGHPIEIIKTIDSSGGWVFDVQVSGDYAYVAADFSGVFVANISNILSAFVVDGIDTDGRANGICVSGNYAYLADREGGLKIIDVSNPTSLSIIHSVDTPGEAYDVAVDWNRAYVADGQAGGLQIVDITDPAAATIIRSVPLPDANSVFPYGNYVCVTGGKTGLHVVSVNPVNSASLKDTIETSGYATSIDAAGGYLFATDSYTGLHSIKMAFPSSSSLTDTYSVVSFANDMSIWDYSLFIAGGLSGLQIVDVSAPETANFIKKVDTPGDTVSVSVDAGLGCVADTEVGLVTIDVDPASSAAVLDSYQTGGEIYNVSLNGDYAFALERYQKMQVFGINPPDSISLATTFELPGDLNDLFTVNNCAYLVDYTGHFYIVDISSPDTPSIIKTLDVNMQKSVFAAGDYAYAARNTDSLDIIDINPPQNADIVKTAFTPDFPTDVYVSQGYAYVACGWDGLQIIDIDPYDTADIVETFELPPGEEPEKVIVSEGFAYVSIKNGGGIRIIDLW
jgi:hypothetical protein